MGDVLKQFPPKNQTTLLIPPNIDLIDKKKTKTVLADQEFACLEAKSSGHEDIQMDVWKYQEKYV